MQTKQPEFCLGCEIERDSPTRMLGLSIIGCGLAALWFSFGVWIGYLLWGGA